MRASEVVTFHGDNALKEMQNNLSEISEHLDGFATPHEKHEAEVFLNFLGAAEKDRRFSSTARARAIAYVEALRQWFPKIDK
jgi:hypothetical protein